MYVALNIALTSNSYVLTLNIFLARLNATKTAKHLFVMELKDNCFIDSRKKASISRFINHSCEPNCTIEIWTVKRRLKAAIFSLKDIPRGMELTFDYQWAPSEGRPPTRSDHRCINTNITSHTNNSLPCLRCCLLQVHVWHSFV